MLSDDHYSTNQIKIIQLSSIIELIIIQRRSHDLFRWWNKVQINQFLAIFRWGGGTPLIFCTFVVYPPFLGVVTAILCFWCALRNNILKLSHVLSLADSRHHSQISSLKVAVCAKRVIHFYTIIASEIIFPPDLTNHLKFWADLWVGQGVMRGCKVPSTWLHFPWGQFCQLPCRNQTYVVAYVAPWLDQILSTGISVDTVRLAETPW